jgi:hypothetical protein
MVFLASSFHHFHIYNPQHASPSQARANKPFFLLRLSIEHTCAHWHEAQEHTMQQQKQAMSASEGIAAANVGVRSAGVSVCRPSGSRWTPTPEQLRILKELYYTCGVRSPTAEQIQRITAMLRQHGKIEGKNVFYWFQNHKARERQKKRLTNLDINNAPAADVNHLGVLSLSPSGTQRLAFHGSYSACFLQA